LCFGQWLKRMFANGDSEPSLAALRAAAFHDKPIYMLKRRINVIVSRTPPHDEPVGD